MGYLTHLEPVDGRRRIRVDNPVDGSEVITFSVANADDVAAMVDRARVAFAVASLAGGGISLDARPAPFSCTPAMLKLLDEDGADAPTR